MANVGTADNLKVNAQKYEVFISSVSNEYLFLQDARLVLSHLEQREPTTSGTNVVFSCTPNNSLSVTLVYSTDSWTAEVAGWTNLSTRTNAEYPIIDKLIVRLTAAGGSVTTMTFTSGSKLQSLEIIRGTEGAVKINVVFSIFVDPEIVR